MIQVNSLNVFKPKLSPNTEFRLVLKFGLTIREFDSLSVVDLAEKLESNKEKDQVIILNQNQSIKMFIKQIRQLKNNVHIFCEYKKYNNCYFTLNESKFDSYKDFFTPLDNGIAQVFSLERFRETKSAYESLVRT